MNRMLRIWIVTIGLCALPGVAMADIFMLITGVPGDATAKGHEKWIRVSSLDWTVVADTSWMRGGGASVGKPNPGSMQFVIPTGTWSQHFMRQIGLGKQNPTVVIDAVATDGRPLYRVTAESFYLTQYRLASLPATPLPQDFVDAVFRKIKIEYYAFGADGKLITTFFEWDIPFGTVIPTL